MKLNLLFVVEQSGSSKRNFTCFWCTGDDKITMETCPTPSNPNKIEIL
jgi:hypothetical protein